MKIKNLWIWNCFTKNNNYRRKIGKSILKHVLHFCIKSVVLPKSVTCSFGEFLGLILCSLLGWPSSMLFSLTVSVANLATSIAFVNWQSVPVLCLPNPGNVYFESCYSGFSIHKFICMHTTDTAHIGLCQRCECLRQLVHVLWASISTSVTYFLRESVGFYCNWVSDSNLGVHYLADAKWIWSHRNLIAVDQYNCSL